MGGHWKVDDADLVRQTKEALKELITVARNHSQAKKRFSADEVRQAAKRFPNRTSTGSDNWTIREISLMPDPILATYADNLSDMRHSAVPPLQALLNMMGYVIPVNSPHMRKLSGASEIDIVYSGLEEIMNNATSENWSHAYFNDLSFRDACFGRAIKKIHTHFQQCGLMI